MALSKIAFIPDPVFPKSPLSLVPLGTDRVRLVFADLRKFVRIWAFAGKNWL